MGISSQRLKLKPVNLNGKSVEDFCAEKVVAADKRIRNKGLEGNYENYREAFDDILSDKFFRKEDKIYEILVNQENEADILIKHNADSTIDIMMYYDDGANHWTDFLKDEETI
jgi:hypothetical protein